MGHSSRECIALYTLDKSTRDVSGDVPCDGAHRVTLGKCHPPTDPLTTHRHIRRTTFHYNGNGDIQFCVHREAIAMLVQEYLRIKGTEAHTIGAYATLDDVVLELVRWSS